MSQTSLRILFLNAENLFSPLVNFYGSSYTQAEYDAKIEWMAHFIVDKQAHIVGLTEIGSHAATCIADLVNRIQQITGSMNFSHQFIGQPGVGSTQIRNAVLSEYPIDIALSTSLDVFPAGFEVNLHSPGTAISNPANWQTVPYTRFNRPVVKARIQLPRFDLNLFVVHLKSKRPKLSSTDNGNVAIGSARSAIMRTTEAAALRYYLDTFLPNQYNVDNSVPSVLIGDFNAEPTSVPVEIIRGPFDKKIGPASNWSEPDKRRMISCARMHLKFTAFDDKLYSYIHNEVFSLIDQGFVSQHLTSKFKRMEMYNDHVIRHQLMSTQTTNEAQQWKSKVSDHGAFVLEFTRVL